MANDPQRVEILRRLDIAAEFLKHGGRIPPDSKPSITGWLPVHAINRTDEHPSAALNVGNDPSTRGIYVDHGKTATSFFNVLAQLPGSPFFTGNDAFRHYGEKTGVFHDGGNGAGAGGTAGKKKKKDCGTIVATYDYHDSQGNLFFQVCRMDPKSFRQRRPNGTGGWTWDLVGIQPVLYHLPELAPAALVYVVEGEKDVDRLRSLGAVATCNPMGAGKWRDYFNASLKGKAVVILPDNDDPGRTHAYTVAQALHGIAASVKIVELPGLQAKGDVSDWIEAGGTLEQLRNLASGASEYDPATTLPPEPKPISTTSTKEFSNECGFTYTIRNDRHCLVVNSEDGMQYKNLCNFVAQVTDEVTRDDGALVTKEFLVDGAFQGRRLPTAKVTTKEFDSLVWVRREWGANASVTPVRNNATHLINAILSRSRVQGINYRVLYAHSGWRKIDGSWRYLSAGGGLGEGEPVSVDLGEKLNAYSLPDEPGGQEAAQASLNFLNIGPWEITAPLWACVYLAPFSDLLKIDFSIWLYGGTGSMKSTLAALALSHFGNFDRRNLPGAWFSTANSLEHLTHTLKDTLCVIDDFNPPSNQREFHVATEKAGRIIYQVGNRSARGRMGPDMKARPDYYPRGLIISTAEMLLPGQRQSATARYLAIELDSKKAQTQIDVEKLAECQQERHLYPATMTAYLQHFANDDLENQIEGIQAQWEGYRTAFQQAGQHLRIPEILAWLATGFELGLQHQTRMGVITEDQAYEMLNRAWATFKSLGERHATLIEGEQPVVKFMSVLRELFYQGRVYVESANSAGSPPSLHQRLLGWHGTEPEKNAEMIGWADDEFLYLLSESTIKSVKNMIRQQGENFPLEKREILSILVKNKIVEASEKTGESSKPKKIQGTLKRVIFLPIVKFLEENQ